MEWELPAPLGEFFCWLAGSLKLPLHGPPPCFLQPEAAQEAVFEDEEDTVGVGPAFRHSAVGGNA